MQHQEAGTSLEELIRICEWAVERTRKIIPYSSNLPDPKRPLSHRNLLLEASRRRKSPLIKEIWKWGIDLSPEKEIYPLADSEVWVNALGNYIHFKELAEVVKELPHMTTKEGSQLEWVETLALKALKFGIGNCAETSAYAMLLLFEYPPEGIPELGLPKLSHPIRIERVSFMEADHTFLILNLAENIAISDVENYNDEAVFCDPWTNEVYTKKQLFENKNQAEIDYIKSKFEKIAFVEPCMEKAQFLRNGFDHSERWHRRVQENASEAEKDASKHKFWRPQNLIDITERPTLLENLPSTRRPNIVHVTQNFAKQKKSKQLPITLPVLRQLYTSIQQKMKNGAYSIEALNTELNDLKNKIKAFLVTLPHEESVNLLEEPFVQAIGNNNPLFQGSEELKNAYRIFLLRCLRGLQQSSNRYTQDDYHATLLKLHAEILKQLQINPQINPKFLNDTNFLVNLCNIEANLLFAMIEEPTATQKEKHDLLVETLDNFVTQDALYQKIADHIADKYLNGPPVNYLLKKYEGKPTAPIPVQAWQAIDRCIKDNKKVHDPLLKMSNLYKVLYEQCHQLGKVRSYRFIGMGNPFRAINYGLLNLRRPVNMLDYFDENIVNAARLGMHQANLAIFTETATTKLTTVLNETIKLQEDHKKAIEKKLETVPSEKEKLLEKAHIAEDRITRIQELLEKVKLWKLDSLADAKNLYRDLYQEINEAQDLLRKEGGRYGLLDKTLTILKNKLIELAKTDSHVEQPLAKNATLSLPAFFKPAQVVENPSPTLNLSQTSIKP